MLYLLLSILCSVLLGFVFKLFVRHNVDIFQAIVVNYIICFCCGWLHLGYFPLTLDSFKTPWMPYALILGLVFVTAFNVAALTVKYFGVTVSQIMQRMSILLTVPFAIWVYGETSGAEKVIGFFLALLAIVLVNWPSKEAETKVSGAVSSSRLLWIPLLTWILCGVIEVMFIRIKYEGLTDMDDPTFILTVFGTAGVLGLLGVIWGYFRRRLFFARRNVLGGVLLGIPNYGSMVFLFWALNSGLEGSFLFPVVNVGVIVVTTIGAVALFQERLSGINWLGIVLAVLAICLISYR